MNGPTTCRGKWSDPPSILYNVQEPIRLVQTPLRLLLQLVELARNVRRVAVKDHRVAFADLSSVRHDDNLGLEDVVAGPCELVLRVRRDVATPDVLDNDVPDVEPDLVTRLRLGERLVLGLRTSLRLKAARCKSDHRPGLQDTRLNPPNRYSPNPRDLVDVPGQKT